MAVELVDNVVLAFSITISDPDLTYPIDAQTQLTMRGELGRDVFAKLADYEGKLLRPSDRLLWIGANRWAYNEAYYMGNPGAYQHYWLSHNMAGVGNFDSGGVATFATGSYTGSPFASQNDETTGPEPKRDAITVNTLTVMNQEVRQGLIDPEPHGVATVREEFFLRLVVGTDRQTLRLNAARLRLTPGRRLRRSGVSARRAIMQRRR